MFYDNNYLADIIYYFHILIILFIIITPFTNITLLLILHVTFCLCLFMHWYYNSDICFLTVLECQLRGIKKINSFTYQFIKSIYNISSSKYNKLIWCTTLLMCFISIKNLYYSENIKNVIIYYNNINSKITIENIKDIIEILQKK